MTIQEAEGAREKPRTRYESQGHPHFDLALPRFLHENAHHLPMMSTNFEFISELTHWLSESLHNLFRLSVNRSTSWGPSPQHMKHFVREGTSQPQGNSCGHCVTMHSIFHWVAWNHSAALYQLLLLPANRVPKLPFLSEQYHQTETLANLMNVKCALVEISSNICPWELLNCPAHSPQ